MTLFAQFVLTFGALLALVVLVLTWLLRTAAAPIALKIVVPVVLVFLACYAPTTVRALLGYPVEVDCAELPKGAELLAFSSNDDAHTVDLWLVDQEPRIYRTAITKSLRAVLAQAREKLDQGQRVALRRGACVLRVPPKKQDGADVEADIIDGPEIDGGKFGLPAKGDNP